MLIAGYQGVCNKISLRKIKSILSIDNFIVPYTPSTLSICFSLGIIDIMLKNSMVGGGHAQYTGILCIKADISFMAEVKLLFIVLG